MEFPVLYRYALAMGADGGLAEDAASEAFTRLIRDLPELRLDGASAVRGWLIVVCRNYLRDHLRRGSRVSREPLEEHDRPSEDPDSILRVSLSAALALLPDSQREVLVMRFMLGMSSREVADASGRGVKAVESLQHRGLETLRRSPALREELA